jgi:hypothetical protein
MSLAVVLLIAVPTTQSQSHEHHAPAVATAVALRQVEDVKRIAAALSTTDNARESGYEPALGWIPMMGTHWVNGPRCCRVATR